MAFPTRRSGALLVALISASFLLTGCTSAASDSGSTSSSDAILKVGTVDQIEDLDPVDASSPLMQYYQPVYDTLIKRTPKNTFEPMLATKWSYNAARTVLTLTLRSGIKFDDGTPFNGDAVKKNLERFAAAGGSASYELSELKSVVVESPTQVQLDLTLPDPSLIYNLSDAAGLMASPADFSKANALKTDPDGTGPYTLNTSQTAVGTRWVFDRKAHYWGKEPAYKQIVFTEFGSQTALVDALKTDQVDAGLVEDPDQVESASQDSSLKITPVTFEMKMLNLYDRTGALDKPLGNVKVRQALNYAINRKLFVKEIALGRGQVTSQIWAPGQNGYVKSLDDYYPYDPAKAKKLMAEAGYPDGFTITLPQVTSVAPDSLTTAITTDWAKIGVKVQWDTIDMNALFQGISAKKFPGFVFNLGFGSNDWNTIETYVLPGEMNVLGYSDPAANALIAKIRTESDTAGQANLQALNKLIVEDAWDVPFYRMESAIVTDGKVKVTPQAVTGTPLLYNYSPAK